MSGVIDRGTADKFKENIISIPIQAHGYPILLLDSPGGNVDEALYMSELMKENKVHTIIPNNSICASACASIIFIAGHYRTMEVYGLFGQHSCAKGNTEDKDCNEIISQHAVEHGVSHGSVAAFLRYASPEKMIWLDRTDLDGWGISRYPGVENVEFYRSEPLPFKYILNVDFQPQGLWRLDTWYDGWKAFLRPVRDDIRDLQIDLSCSQIVEPGSIFITLNILEEYEKIEKSIISSELITNTLEIENSPPFIYKIDNEATGVIFLINKENVIDFLTKADDLSIRVNIKDPYDDILVTGKLAPSRKNLLFAANNCAN